MKQWKFIKRTTLAVVFVLWLLVATGCAGSVSNNTENTELKEMQKDSATEIELETNEFEANESEITTELEDEENPHQEKSLFDGIQEFPQYEIRKLGIENILLEQEEVRALWDMQIVDERIYLVMKTYEETLGFRYRLVTCNQSGDDLQSVILQMPEMESANYSELVNFVIGMDGKVYGTKYVHSDPYMTFTEVDHSFLSWNTDGQICSEIKLQKKDLEKYYTPPQSIMVRLLSVSEQGELVFYMWTNEPLFILHTSSEGIVLGAYGAESFTAFNTPMNQDGTLSSIYVENGFEEEYDLFYSTYDMHSRTFSERIPIHDDILRVTEFGISKDVFILYEYERKNLYKYYPLENTIEPLAQLEENKYLQNVWVINEQNFLIYNQKDGETGRIFDGIYYYTLINE